MPTKAIAELAGVSESTFFRIYKSKAALLSDLLYIMTPGPEDIPMKEMTNGTDIRKDFELFLYHNALLHVRHLPVFQNRRDDLANGRVFSSFTGNRFSH